MRRSTFITLLLASSLTAFGQEAEETEFVQLPERLQQAYLSAVPQDFIVDPQRLLRGAEGRERREFLKYHSSDSLIDLHVVLFKGDQQLMDQGRLAARHESWIIGRKPSVFIHYHMGRPDRSEMYLSSDLGELVPFDERSRALSSAVDRAMRGISSQDQFEKFLVQASIRITRMEPVLNAGDVTQAPLRDEAPHEVDANQAERESLFQAIGSFWSEWKFKLIGALIGIGGIAFVLRWRRQRATHVFPDSEVQERLGGAHGAGVGAVIEFGKSSKPPAAQLEKLKLH